MANEFEKPPGFVSAALSESTDSIDDDWLVDDHDEETASNRQVVTPPPLPVPHSRSGGPPPLPVASPQASVPNQQRGGPPPLPVSEDSGLRERVGGPPPLPVPTAQQLGSSDQFDELPSPPPVPSRLESGLAPPPSSPPSTANSDRESGIVPAHAQSDAAASGWSGEDALLAAAGNAGSYPPDPRRPLRSNLPGPQVPRHLVEALEIAEAMRLARKG